MESERPSASLLASELVFPDRVPRLHYLPFASGPLDLDPSAPLSFPLSLSSLFSFFRSSAFFLCDPSLEIRFYATESSSSLLSTSGSIFFSFQKDSDPDPDRERIGKDSIFVQRWSEQRSQWRGEGRRAWRAGNVGGEEEQAGNINHLESIRHEGSRADDLAVPCCQVHGAPIVSGRPDGSANYQHSGALSSERDLRRV